MKIIKIRENTSDRPLKRKLRFFSKTETKDELEKTIDFIKHQNLQNGINTYFPEKENRVRIKRNKPDISTEEKEGLHQLRKKFYVVLGDYLTEFVCSRVTSCSMHRIEAMYSNVLGYLDRRIRLILLWVWRINCLLDNIDLISEMGGKACLTKKSQVKINWGPVLDYLKEYIIASESVDALISELKSNLLVCRLELLDVASAVNRLDKELRSISIPDQVVGEHLKHDLFKAMHKQLNEFDIYLFEMVKSSLFSVIKQQENIPTTPLKAIFTTQWNTGFSPSNLYHDSMSTISFTRADIQRVKRPAMRVVNNSKVVVNHPVEWAYFAISGGLLLLGMGSLFLIYTVRSYLSKPYSSSTIRYEEDKENYKENKEEYPLATFSK